jgi:hypothetical protein
LKLLPLEFRLIDIVAYYFVLRRIAMKRIVVLIILASLLLGACTQQATPTSTDSDLQTKVAQVLTNIPTATSQGPKAVTATAGLPTVAVSATQKPAEATKPANTATSAPSGATATVAAPTKAATATLAAATATIAATKPAATNTPSGPTATPPAGDPRAKLGNPTWTDKMDKSANWPTGTDPSGFTTVAFNNGFMELTSLKPIDGWRLTHESMANAYLEMTVNTGTCLPKDRYGVIVRVPNASEANRGYMVGFTCDGKFAIRKWDGAANSMTTFINWKANAAINAGADKTNRLGLMMQGNKLSLYANGVLLGEVADNTWSEGVFGIFAGAQESTNYTLKVDEVDIWDLP